MSRESSPSDSKLRTQDSKPQGLEIGADTAPTVHTTFGYAPERKRRARRRNIHKKKRSPVFKNKRPKLRGLEERQHDLKRETANDQDAGPEPGVRWSFRPVKVRSEEHTSELQSH